MLKGCVSARRRKSNGLVCVFALETFEPGLWRTSAGNSISRLMPSSSGSLVTCRLLCTLLREHENLISFRALVFCWALSQLRAIYEGTEGVRVMGQTCWAVWGKRRQKALSKLANPLRPPARPPSRGATQPPRRATSWHQPEGLGATLGAEDKAPAPQAPAAVQPEVCVDHACVPVAAGKTHTMTCVLGPADFSREDT